MSLSRSFRAVGEMVGSTMELRIWTRQVSRSGKDRIEGAEDGVELNKNGDGADDDTVGLIAIGAGSWGW